MALTPEQANALVEAAKAAGVNPADILTGGVEAPTPAGPTPKQLSKMSLRELAEYEKSGGSIDDVLRATSEAEDASTAKAKIRAAAAERETARVEAAEADERVHIVALDVERFKRRAWTLHPVERAAEAAALGLDPETLERKGAS